MRAKEFLNEDVVPFKKRDGRTDAEKYHDTMRDQEAKNWKYDLSDPEISDDKVLNALKYDNSKTHVPKKK